MPNDRVRVARSAPDLSRFVPVEPDPTLYGQMGRDDLHTTFIGNGDVFDEDVFDEMVALTRRLGLDEVVEFTGRVPDETVQRYLSTADICLSPDPKNPLNDVSSMNKVVEYMAMARPLVSFDLHEARVTAQDAAVYASENDEAQFAKLIAELLDNPDRRERMGKIGRQRVEQALSWEISRRSLLAAYEDLLARPPRQREGRRRRGRGFGPREPRVTQPVSPR
jgi:glycosyltransferase involved in cell wall biosynthesis